MEEHVCNIEQRHRAAGQSAYCLPTVRHMFVPLSLNCHEMKFHDNGECMRANVRLHCACVCMNLCMFAGAEPLDCENENKMNKFKFNFRTKSDAIFSIANNGLISISLHTISIIGTYLSHRHSMRHMYSLSHVA